MTEPTVLVVVPARGGSKRVPRKNLRKLAGQPLIAHTAAAISLAGLTARTVLSTDDPEIAEIGAALGWCVPFLRPAELATDSAATADVVLHALDAAGAILDGDPDWTMVLQPTSPFRDPNALRAALAAVAADPTAEGVVGMRRLHVAPAHVFRLGRFGEINQIADVEAVERGEVAMTPNGALYLIRTATLRRTKSFFSGRILPLEMSALASLDIDTEEDFQMAEALAPLVGIPIRKGAP